MPDEVNPPGMPSPAPPTEIVVAPTGATPAPAAAKTPDKPPQHDSFREFIETIVFVVVLVLILKTFLAEAFVIPTGSMATTLLGFHAEITCKQCGYRFLINKSKEAEGDDGRNPQEVTGCTCPNCLFLNDLKPAIRAPKNLQPAIPNGDMP